MVIDSVVDTEGRDDDIYALEIVPRYLREQVVFHLEL